MRRVASLTPHLEMVEPLGTVDHTAAVAERRDEIVGMSDRDLNAAGHDEKPVVIWGGCHAATVTLVITWTTWFR